MKDFRDDFAEILPIFPFVAKECCPHWPVQIWTGPLKNASKLISLHSITAKPKVKNSKTLTPK